MNTVRHKSTLTVLLFALILGAGQPNAHAYTNVDCLLASLSAATPEALHIQQSERGDYEVLIPNRDGTFKIRHFDTYAKAYEEASRVQQLDLKAMIKNANDVFREIMPELKVIKNNNRNVTGLSARIKTPESLMEKIFQKVHKNEKNFRISEIEDIAAARFVVRDRSQIGDVAREVRKIPGVQVVADDLVNYGSGYRATHITLRTSTGHFVEIQIMTKRTSDWSAWNHDRVYKPRVSKGSVYYGQLKRYDQALIHYLNGLDDGLKMLPKVPDPDKYGIYPEDVFPSEQLK